MTRDGSTPTPSRRRLFASGVALCCSAPVSAAAGADGDDAEVIAMGRALEALMPEIEHRHERQTERIEAAHAAVVEDERWATADLAEQHELRTLYEDLHGVNDDEVDPEPLHLRLDEIRRRMEILPATTMSGLQAKAKLVAFRHGPFDEEAADLGSLLRDLGVVRQA